MTKQLFFFGLVLCLFLGRVAPAQQLSRQTDSVSLSWYYSDSIQTPNSFISGYIFNQYAFLPYSSIPYYPVFFPETKITTFGIDSLKGDTLNFDLESLPFSSAEVAKAEPYLHYTYQQGIIGTIAYIPSYYFTNNQIIRAQKLYYSFSSSANNARNGRTADSTFAKTSPLATGTWYKIAVTTDGVYKLDSKALENMGITTSTLNPKNIMLFGRRPGMLPQLNSADRDSALIELPIYVEGEEDNIFNPNDAVYFYGFSPHIWYATNAKATSALPFRHQNHNYSDTTYYYLTVETNKFGKRITTAKNNISSPDTTLNSAIFATYHERNLINPLNSGRLWLGEMFDLNNSQTFNLQLPHNQLDGTNPKIGLALATSATGAANPLATEFNGYISLSPIAKVLIQSKPIGSYTPWGTLSYSEHLIAPELINSQTVSVKLDYNKFSLPNIAGYLDYIDLNIPLKFSSSNSQYRLLFNAQRAFGASYINTELSSAGQKIWKISSNGLNIEECALTTPNIFSTDSLEKGLNIFAIFNTQQAFIPRYVGKVANQNLAGTTPVNLIIITNSLFFGEAQRLADHKAKRGVTSVVVTPSQIYNEYSAGSQDITAIRDFVRSVYVKDTAKSILQNVLLFGDCSFDYKNYTNNNTNFVPIFQSPESMLPLNTYGSDDYYVLLDPSEGNWAPSQPELMDLGIGRLPAKNPTDAKNLVDKIIYYETSETTFGEWRNRLTYVADDGDNGLHQDNRQGADALALIIENSDKAFNLRKIFIDAYPQIITAGGQVTDAGRQALFQSLQNGTLIVNYSGHGNKVLWASEEIFDDRLLSQLNNLDRMALFITATCDYGVYDNPTVVSGGERVVLHKNGGGIALFSATRPVFAQTNFTLNLDFNNVFLQYARNPNSTLGQLLYLSKNKGVKNTGEFNRNFGLLGDPSLRLAFPSLKAKITQINGKSFADASDTIKALSTVTFDGEIVDTNGIEQNDFNGIVEITVFDKPSKITTLSDPAEGKGIAPPYTFQQNDRIIFKGRATVRKGDFQFTFVVPIDIDYNIAIGKISLYAYDAKNKLDATGASMVYIGGSDTVSLSDDQPPLIKAYINDSLFVNKSTVNNNPNLLAHFSDDKGISLATGGIGRQITLTLNNDFANQIILNEYYQANLDDFRSGTLTYPLGELANGKYSAEITAWDIALNSGTTTIEFTIADQPFNKIEDLIVAPNPFSQRVNFGFRHKMYLEDIEVKINIYDLTGRLVHQLSKSFTDNRQQISLSDELYWEPQSSGGLMPIAGLYIYTIEVLNQDGVSDKKAGKIIFQPK